MIPASVVGRTREHGCAEKSRGIPVEYPPSPWSPESVQWQCAITLPVRLDEMALMLQPRLEGRVGTSCTFPSPRGGNSDHGRRPGAIPAFGVHRFRDVSATAMDLAAMSSIMFPSSPHRSGYPNGALSASTARCGAPGVLGRTCRTSAGEWRRTAITSDFRGQISPSRNPVDFPWVILLPFPPASH